MPDVGLDAVDEYLLRADLRFSPRAARALALLVAAGPGFAAAVLGVSVPLLVACVALPGACAAVWLHARVARRPDRVVAQMPDALRRVAAALASGLSLRQALARVAPRVDAPAGPELRRVHDDLEAGARVDDALEALVARVPHHDMDVVGCVTLVALRAGGDLAGLLRDLADGIESRRAAAADLAAMSAQARTTAWLVTAMPVAGAALVELAAPGVVGRTLGGAAGRAVVVLAVAMFAVAVAAVRRLARVRL
ncbi:MAG: type II secretion system F family protein [Thermoleophilia bacterium]|nr:type II secretion system F family protein [Thermoleophilia bacterium]